MKKLDFPDRDLYILADGDWQGWRSIPCQKEPETVEWIREFGEGSLFWDVGASVGPYTLIAGALGYSVDAFEPFFPSLGHLQQNIWVNRDCLSGGVWAYPYALADFTSPADTWAMAGPVPGMAQHGKGKFAQDVPHMRADDFSGADPGNCPDHVKIDVDGYELGVIEGGRETWKQVKSIMVESQPPAVDDITVILDGCGLRLEESWPRWGETKQRNYLYARTGL